MAYTTDDLNVLVPRMLAGPTLWSYTSIDDDAAIEADDDYVTDAVDKGMADGDLVLATTDSDGTTGEAAGIYTVIMNADGITAGLFSPATGRHS